MPEVIRYIFEISFSNKYLDTFSQIKNVEMKIYTIIHFDF